MSSAGMKNQVGNDNWAIPEIRGTPQRRQIYFQLKIWEFPGSNFDLKNGNSKNCFKKWEFQIFYVKNSEKLEIPIFCTKNDWIFGEFPYLLYPCNQKSAYLGEDFLMKNVVTIFGIPMSSLGVCI